MVLINEMGVNVFRVNQNLYTSYSHKNITLANGKTNEETQLVDALTNMTT
jgi:hypothetical protein